MNEVAFALKEFTRRFCDQWQEETGGWPASEALYGIPSPCIVTTTGGDVRWQPQPFTPEADLSAVERALDISLQPAVEAFYTTQFAGDMPAIHGNTALTLLQAWSEDDFVRVQENLIGHLVTQKRLKLSPTLFLATTEDEMEVVSLCNLTGEVVIERIGTPQRTVLSTSLSDFLNALTPQVI
ncbi:SecY-interacting protein [Klebsiella sp. Ap-873]|uniref:Protein Syd n=1 Tax=Cedecea neteri TaxID=158822 RepID=A0AAN0S0N6_9ENTR|nr:SecY-interacting protein [Cedecea neteri]AIR59318.1 secretion protein [Cedecea neteri]NIG78030.1 SecY-interacting protein [Klebsiella sp. Ap-873]